MSNSPLIKTASGSSYQVIGVGQKAKVQMKDFELLRNGFSQVFRREQPLQRADFPLVIKKPNDVNEV